MPSQTISFSGEGYVRLQDRKPEDATFSEWVENLALEGLENGDVQVATEADTNGGSQE
jgi:predicted CopG family antitoxin